MADRRLRVIDTNDAVLSVIKVLSSYEKEINLGVASIGNIYSIFFHDLVIHFSGIIIQRESVESGTSIAKFPYVSREYALYPAPVSSNYFKTSVSGNSLKRRLREMRLLSYSIGNALPFGYKQDYWLSKLVNLLGEHQRPVKVFIRQMDLQLDSLSDCISDICIQHAIPNYDVIRDIWLEYVRYQSTEELKPATSKILLIGSRYDLQNRKLSHNYLEQGKEVIAFTHGEIASTIFDEPMYRYGEWSLCSTLVEYGKIRLKPKHEGLMLAPKQTLYRNSKVAMSKYRQSDMILPTKLDGMKLLYIPTTYVGDEVYGPYHSYADSVYWEWHSAILRVVPSVVFKTHPKSRGSMRAPGPEDRRWLDDCINEYDVLIVDYVATSTVVAMLSDKPVLYFDIGLRRLAQDFQEVVKERCHYISVDINGNLDQQLQEGIASFSLAKCCWSNLKLTQYCFSKNTSFHWRDIFLDAM